MVCAAALGVALGCGPAPETNAPPIASASSADTESGTNPGSGPFDPPQDPCDPDEDVDSTGGDALDETGSDFKFDVGAPDGPIGFGLSCDDVEGAPSNLGCTFWAVDLPNDEQGTPESPPAADQPFAVVVANVSALTPALVQVFVGDDDLAIAEATVDPADTFVFDLGVASVPAAASSVDDLAFRIESDVPIAAYQFNPAANLVEVYSNDASLLLPEHALGEDYTAATADGILLGTSTNDPDPVNAGAFVSVVAIADGTHVELSPTSGIVGPLPDPLVLDRGEVATVMSDALSMVDGNLTGTRVHADKPVAVFSGNVATTVPRTISIDDLICCADHVEHQLLPDTAWGDAYAVAPPPHPEGTGEAEAVYTIVAGPDGADLLWCPQRPSTAPIDLAPGEVAEFRTDDAFTVKSDDDAPFGLTQFTLSSTELGDSGLGDPAMIVIVPAGQHERRSLFVVPAGYVANWATIVVRGPGRVSLDGEELDDDDFTDLGTLSGIQHRYIHVALEAGTHALEADAPAGVTVTGIARYVGYGFAGGTGVRLLSVPPAAG